MPSISKNSRTFIAQNSKTMYCHLKSFFLLTILFLATSLCAQEGVAIGNWRTHMPYQNVISVDKLGSIVYAATEYELFTYDEEDNSIRILNKINGLSDVGVSVIRHNETLDLMVVAYKNANIDLIDKNGNIINMSDIKDKTILGNKTINDVTFVSELAYFACGFGIVVYDLNRQEVKDTYYIGENGDAVNVTDIAFYKGRIYAATTEGLYSADAASNTLSNYASWTFETNLINPNLSYNELEVFGEKLLINFTNGTYNTDTLFVFDGTVWDYYNPKYSSNKREIRAVGDRLLVSNYGAVHVFNTSFEQIENIYSCDGSVYPNTAFLDANGFLWIGDMRRGMIKAKDNWNYEEIKPNGTYTKNVFELSHQGKHVWIATGGHDSNWAKKYAKQGVCHFDGNWWVNLNNTNIQAFNDEKIDDFICCATDPFDTTVTYVGTWGSGVLKFVNDEYKMRYDTTNSSLEAWTQNHKLVNISGLGFDSKGNLWVANTGANNLLSVMDREGHWKSFNLGGANSGIDISIMVIDHNDYKWILRRSGNDDKIIVFNDNGTLDNTSDDQVVVLRCVAGHGGISGSAVNCLAVDRKGYVWVGTDSGPCYYQDTRKLFTAQNYDANQVMIPRNDGTLQADPLFNEIQVLSIAVDGNNNKWFGLESGVYEMSADCKTQLLHFNMDNSPLLDNSVNTMTINDIGEVFFGTDQGVISYRGIATPGGTTNSEVMVYPNPVRPGYNGYVGIKGLVEDALVRITTVDGTFVTQLLAEGGQAVWDCTTVDGKKVLPGIYLVFVSTRSGSERLATKIMVMN